MPLDGSVFQGRDARWLVCAGAGEFLETAPKLIGAGFARGIAWEPTLAGALRRLDACDGERMGVIVGHGCGGARSAQAASALAGNAGAGTVILCVAAPADDGEDMLPAGVDVLVRPECLLDYLLSMGAYEGRRSTAPTPYDAGDEWWMRQRSCAREEGGRRRDAPTPTPTGRGGLRASGSFPRVGVETAACDVRDAGDDLGRLVGEGAGRPGSRSEGRRQAGAGGRRDELSERVPEVTPVAGGARREGVGAPPSWRDDGHGHGSDGDAWGAAHETSPEEPLRVPVATPPPAIAPSIVVADDRAAGMPPVPTICLASARGGVGKSAIAALMGVSLARAGLHVALLDLDYQFGTCLGYLGAPETDGITDIEGDELRLDDRLLARCRATPERGLDAYEFCRLPERSELLVQVSGALVQAARARADVAVVDLPTGVSEGVAQVLEVSDRCLLVTDQRALSLESVGALAALCSRAGVPITKVVGVINRCDARHKDETYLTRARFEMNLPQIAHVIDGGPDVDRMLAIGCAGELVSMRNRMALSVADLASSMRTDLGVAAGAVAPAPAPVPLDIAASAGRAKLGGRRRQRAVVRKDLVACPS